jgi:hypothetical protein
MSVSAAFEALHALRCEGVDGDCHYPIGTTAPKLPDKPTIFWQFATDENWAFYTEVYDAEAGALAAGVTLTLLVNRYYGTGQAAQILALPGWADRLLAMLATDILLANTLTQPMAGFMRRIGVIEGKRGKYVGVMMDLRFSVRIES